MHISTICTYNIHGIHGNHYQLSMHRRLEIERKEQTKDNPKLNAENENAICVVSYDTIVSVAFDPNKVGRVSSPLNLR